MLFYNYSVFFYSTVAGHKCEIDMIVVVTASKVVELTRVVGSGMYVTVLMFMCVQQDGIYVNERFLHTFASCIVSIMIVIPDTVRG